MPQRRTKIDNLANSDHAELQIITVNIPRRHLKTIERLLTAQQISRSEWVRRAVEYYLVEAQKLESFVDDKVKEYDAVQLYMEQNGYHKIRRLE